MQGSPSRKRIRTGSRDRPIVVGTPSNPAPGQGADRNRSGQGRHPHRIQESIQDSYSRHPGAIGREWEGGSRDHTMPVQSGTGSDTGTDPGIIQAASGPDRNRIGFRAQESSRPDPGIIQVSIQGSSELCPICIQGFSRNGSRDRPKAVRSRIQESIQVRTRFQPIPIRCRSGDDRIVVGPRWEEAPLSQRSPVATL